MAYHFESSEAYLFDFDSETWEKIDIDWNENFGTRFCVVYCGTTVLLIGGIYNGTLNRVLQLENSSIRKLTPMLSNRADLCAVSSSDTIYAIGGYNEESEQALSTVEAFNIEKNKWTSLPQLIYPRVNSAAIINAQFIYVCGGVGVSTIERFDMHNEEWVLCDLILPVSISSLGIFVVASGSVMIFGGKDESGAALQNVWMFDLQNESIVMQQQLRKPFSVNKPTILRFGMIYLFNNKEFTTYNIGRLRERTLSEISLTPSKIEYVRNEDFLRNSLEQGIFHVDRHSVNSFKVSLPNSPKVLIVRRIGKDDEIESVYMRTVRYLLDKNTTVFVEADRSKDLNPQVRRFHEGLCDKINLVITLGGDGTVIWAISLFKHKSMPPLLAFNMGSLGFMTSYNVANLTEVLDQVFTSPSIHVDLMSRLKCHVKDISEKAWGQAANEICIDRGPGVSLLELEVYLNGELCTTAIGDGLLIATPCGSTAYSLSAGGSIVHHGVPAILITPICPHSLSFRPILLPDSVTITIKVPENSRIPAWVGIDGHSKFKLARGASMDVTVSNYPVPNINLNHDIASWLGRLNNILGWNDRRRQKPIIPY
ncbi:unnamed protein product [Blepharisma stoltei]|uniref:NAD(+) kinase n=1 Tax=Blepharisma stoltei TaxID=1481888 RepID=A0AAU9IDL7_9CILI|nr:unnamed protein product [Blepharisma stoltei]